ncbi:MAG: hypothetical protein Q7J54_00455 [Candidatus Woesearchaeota archaeon]|nr:hypothetical protein [Candidatus Woesearchaeota archaeon]
MSPYLWQSGVPVIPPFSVESIVLVPEGSVISSHNLALQITFPASPKTPIPSFAVSSGR